jgi:hypothetical protein
VATTEAPGIGCPASSTTLPFRADVVEPCPKAASPTSMKNNIAKMCFVFIMKIVFKVNLVTNVWLCDIYKKRTMVNPGRQFTATLTNSPPAAINCC